MSTATRTAVAQCDLCLASVTAELDQTGEVLAVDVPFVRDRAGVFHKDCAGRFVGIGVGDDL